MSHMRIQAALDYNLTMADALRIIEQSKESVEVFEIGTPFLKSQGGLDCIKTVREKYPDLVIYADTKVSNEGARSGLEGTPYQVIENTVKAGANIVTVMAYSDDAVVEEVIRAGHDCGAEVLVDLMNIEDVVAAAKKYDAMGADYVSVNTLYVNQPADKVPNYYKPLVDLELITPHLVNAKASIQGVVTLENLPQIAKFAPSLICIGRGIYAAEDPGAAAKAFKAILDEAEQG